jgi:dihydroneopterin aldolase
MIEHPAARIADNILILNHVLNVKVEVEKLNVPINANFSKISVSIERKNS